MKRVCANKVLLCSRKTSEEATGSERKQIEEKRGDSKSSEDAHGNYPAQR